MLREVVVSATTPTRDSTLYRVVLYNAVGCTWYEVDPTMSGLRLGFAVRPLWWSAAAAARRNRCEWWSSCPLPWRFF